MGDRERLTLFVVQVVLATPTLTLYVLGGEADLRVLIAYGIAMTYAALFFRKPRRLDGATFLIAFAGMVAATDMEVNMMVLAVYVINTAFCLLVFMFAKRQS